MRPMEFAKMADASKMVLVLCFMHNFIREYAGGDDLREEPDPVDPYSHAPTDLDDDFARDAIVQGFDNSGKRHTRQILLDQFYWVR